MSEDGCLRIGWALEDVTPDKPVSLCGQFYMRISQSVKDPLTLTALSVSTDKDVFIWVSCDMPLITEDIMIRSRAGLKQNIPDFPSEKLIINATHTHTAPDIWGEWYPPVPEGVMGTEEYKDFLIKKIVSAASKSWIDRKPGSLSWGYSYAVAAHNRRSVFFDDLSKREGYPEQSGRKTDKNAAMYGKTDDPNFDSIEGYVDHSVNILFTYDGKKKLTGAVVNVPCPSQVTAGLREVSADFWHETRIELRKKHGENLFVLPQCAAAGDMSPTLLYNKKAEARMLELKGITPRQAIAERLASAFSDAYQWSKKDIRKTVNMKHSVVTVPLSVRVITEEEYEAAKSGLASLEQTPPSSEQDPVKRLNEDSVIFSRAQRCRKVIERFTEQKKGKTHIPSEIHIVRIGDIVFATSPFELFLDYGIRIQARSPAVQTFTVQLTAGLPCTGSYLPTKKAEAGEGYSACIYCNEVVSKGGQELVEETLKTINELWKE